MRRNPGTRPFARRAGGDNSPDSIPNRPVKRTRKHQTHRLTSAGDASAAATAPAPQISKPSVATVA
eukprot:10300478-Lingulodinium_polyedra.AAC.1